MSRTSWLERPWFLAAVALLALNDHLLKGVGPGWLTGKLSDFTGLVVVGTLAAVVLGRNVGLVLVGAAFAALKVVPGVAEFAAPLLGGVTLRDASDLIALTTIPVVWGLLDESQPLSARPRRAVEVAGLMAALLVTTATADPMPEQTHDLLRGLGSARDGSFYILLDKVGDKSDRYLRSADGGRSWQESPAPDEPLSDARGVTPSVGAPSPTSHMLESIAQACADDGVCYRTWQRDLNTLPDESDWQTDVQRREPGGNWTTEKVYGHSDKDRFSIFAVNPLDSTQLVAQVGDGRIVYRTAGGDYRVVDVLPR